MNISYLHRITALLLALLMFTTSIGYSMDVHYCGNEIKSIGLFGNAVACEMESVEKQEEDLHACCKAPELNKESETCHSQKIEEEDCCHNETIVLETDSDFNHDKTIDFDFQQDFVFTTLFIYNVFAFRVEENTVNDNFYYSPPKLTKDVMTLHQVFII